MSAIKKQFEARFPRAEFALTDDGEYADSYVDMQWIGYKAGVESIAALSQPAPAGEPVAAPIAKAANALREAIESAPDGVELLSESEQVAAKDLLMHAQFICSDKFWPPLLVDSELTDKQMFDLVKECGLDWHRGYMPLFDGDPTNRYAVLIEAAVAADRAKRNESTREAVIEECAKAVEVWANHHSAESARPCVSEHARREAFVIADALLHVIDAIRALSTKGETK